MKKQKKEIDIQLIPVYIPDAEFQEHKKVVQNLIARIFVAANSKKRGRPKKDRTDDKSEYDGQGANTFSKFKT